MQSKRNALRAWTRSSLVCIIASPAIFLIWDFFESGTSGVMNSLSGQLGLFLVISAVAAVVHYSAFIALGLPLFLRFHRKPYSRVWRWPFGIAIGATIGILTVSFVPALAWGRPVDHTLFESAAMGALYGAVTAIACLLNRPNVEVASGSR